MKILLFRTDPSVMNIKNYNSQEIGLAKAYTRLGHTCDIVYYHGKAPGHVQEIDAGDGKIIRIFWMKGFSILNNGFFPGISKLVERYDVIQVSEYYFWGSWYICQKFKKTKKVYIYQGVYDSDNSIKFKLRCKVMDRFLLTKKIKATVPVFTKSRLAEASMLRRGFRNVKTVGVGLDVSRLHNELPPSDWVQSVVENKGDDLYLLYIGVLEDRRNSLFLLDVLRRVTDTLPRVKLVVVGRGKEEYAALFHQKVEASGLAPHVLYRESLPQGELAHLYRAADLFVLPTKYEIFGMVIMEAMSFGVPVVSSLNGGSGTVIEDGVNGRIVQTFDVDDWVDAICQMLQDKEKRTAMGQAALATGAEKFSWDAIALQMAEEFE